jgi:class 3 adenylate cyclase/predicted Ser/Thr protein kinase
MDDALPFPIGGTVDSRYRVVALLGQGGMGAVYRAEQLSLQREVALKVLRADLAGPEAAARFSREALALSRLDHPNIVRVIDSGQAEGRPYLVMELVSGRDLQTELYRGPLTPERAVPILVALCDALAAAHAQGIIHRDLKPENVILTESGVPKILDFGIAVAADGSQRVTQAGFVLGTPEYLAPEQAMGQQLTARSDLYTLGVMAYRMLSGQLPFTASEPREYLLLHAGTPAPELSETWLAGPQWPELCAVIMRALQKDPEKRPPDALAMKRALEEALAHRGPAPEPGTVQLRAGEAAPATSASSVLAVKTQNLAVLFVAIGDWDKRVATLPPHAASALQARFEALLVPGAKRFGGRKIKVVGGTLILSVPSPTAAVECAMALQDRLWEARRGGSPEQLTARISLSMGEVTVQEGDLFGEPVNIAARVQELAAEGEVVFTDAVYLAMNRSELLADELGPQQLKGIPFPVKVYRVRQGSVSELPPYGTRGGEVQPAMSRALEAVGAGVGQRGRLVAIAVAVALLIGVGLFFGWRHAPASPIALERAEDALTHGDPREAQKLLRPLLAARPPPARALALSGRAAIALDDWAQGLALLREAAKADPLFRGELVNACVKGLGQPTQGKRRSCLVRLQAITLLTAFDAAESRSELQRLATSTECGHDEARAALGAITSAPR